MDQIYDFDRAGNFNRNVSNPLLLDPTVWNMSGVL